MPARDNAVFAATFVILGALVGTSPATSQIVDQGLVLVDSSNNLRIGIDAYGQREITNFTDGPYSAVSLGEDVSGDGHLIIGHNGSLSAIGELSVGLPAGGLGTLQITDGATLFTAGARINSGFFGIGPEVLISGSGTTWSNAGLLSLGIQPNQSPWDSGMARMIVSSGASVETTGLSMYTSGGPPISTLTITDVGTQFLNTGNLSMTGTQIDVTNGARYQGDGWLGMYPHAPSRISVRGTNSAFKIGPAIIGGDYVGEFWLALDVNSGGQFITQDAKMFTQQVNRARISDPGSMWIVNGDLFLAPFDGFNFLEILNGAKVSSITSQVWSGSAAFVRISGSGSEWSNTGTFGLSSSYGQASILIEAGGTLRTGEFTTCGGFAESGAQTCRLTVDGSSSHWISSGNATVVGDAITKAYVTAVSGGAISLDGTMMIQDAGFLSLDAMTLTLGRDLILVDYELEPSAGPSLNGTNAFISVARHLSQDRKLTSEFELADSSVQFRGGNTLPNFSFHGLEVGGLDAGDHCELLADDNFGIGQVTIGHTGAPTLVSLYNAMDNGHRNGPAGSGEALYLFGGGGGSRCGRSTDGLVMEPGSVLELNEINTYVYDAALGELVHLNAHFPGSPNPNEISMFGGTIRLVPEPSLSIGLIAGGAVLTAMALRASKP